MYDCFMPRDTASDAIAELALSKIPLSHRYLAKQAYYTALSKSHLLSHGSHQGVALRAGER